MKEIVIIEPIGITNDDFKIFYDNFAAIGYKIISYNSIPDSLSEAKNRVKNAEIIITANYPLTREIFTNKLKMISVAFTGVDHIDIDYCNDNNICVCNSAKYSTEAVSELTIGLMISSYRNFTEENNNTKNGLTRNNFLGKELKNKTVGVIGTGAIGSRVIDFLQIFGCKILAYSRTQKEELNCKVTYTSLDELLSQSDIITLHIPLNNKTKHLLNQEKLNLLKQDSIIINTARGSLIDNNYLAKLLENNKVAGAALDVYDYEPPLKQDYAILKAPNTILLPHVGYATKEAIKERSEIVFENIKLFSKGKSQNLVNEFTNFF